MLLQKYLWTVLHVLNRHKSIITVKEKVGDNRIGDRVITSRSNLYASKAIAPIVVNFRHGGSYAIRVYGLWRIEIGVGREKVCSCIMTTAARATLIRYTHD